MVGASQGRRALWRRFWNFLASRRVAVFLLLLALLLTLPGLAIPQPPAELDAAGRKAWQEAMGERYGPVWGIYRTLGLTDLFHTPLFWTLGAALFLNLLACTVDRLGRLLRAMRRPPLLHLPETAYAPTDRKFSLQEARRHLWRWGYRWWEEPSRPHYFHGETPHLAPLGTLLSHLGLFLLIPGLLLQPLAWRDRLLLDVGASSGIPLPHHSTCAVAAVGLQAEEAGGFLRSVSGELLIREGEAVIRGRTGPEGPLSACGVNFYLRSYGLALQVEAADRSGRPLDIVLPKEGQVASLPPEEPSKRLGPPPQSVAGSTVLRFPAGATERSFDVPSLALHITVVPSATALAGFREGLLQVHIEQAGLNRPLFDGRIAPNTTLELPAGRLSFRPASFLEVEAVYDPGFPLLLSAGCCLVAGSVLSLFFPQRSVWARLDEDGTLWVRFGREEDTPGGTT